jgi:hypothetical protein
MRCVITFCILWQKAILRELLLLQRPSKGSYSLITGQFLHPSQALPHHSLEAMQVITLKSTGLWLIVQPFKALFPISLLD